MNKFFKKSAILMLITTTMVLADPVDPSNDTNDRDKFEYLPPDQWKFPPPPEEGAVNSHPELETKPLSELVQPLPKLTNKEEIIKDVLTHYPEVARKVRLLNSPSVRQEFLPRQLLLVGQPGVGKTTVAMVLAHILNRKVAFFSGARLLGIDNIENTLGRVFREVQDSGAQYLVVIDEFMLVAEDLEKGQGEAKKKALLIWSYLDRLRQTGKVFFVGTGISAKELPTELKSHFLGDILRIDVPQKEYRKKIISNITGKDLSDDDLELLADKTDGFTHRRIENVALCAMQFATERDDKDPKVRVDDFQQSLKQLQDQDK